MGISRWTLMDDGKPVEVALSARMHSNTLDAVVAAAVEGAGIVYAPAWTVQPYLESKQLQEVLPSSKMPARPLFALMTHQRLLAAKVRVLLEFLSERIG